MDEPAPAPGGARAPFFESELRAAAAFDKLQTLGFKRAAYASRAAFHKPARDERSTMPQCAR